MKALSLLFGEPVWKKYLGLLYKYPGLQKLLEKGKTKIPKNLKGIENKHMLKKALEHILRVKGIQIKGISIKEDKRFYYVTIKY